ncbi:MAG: hypothetical protein Q8R11_00110 [bacterium]|nr:hypothetical protein [bacterium]
MNKITSLFSYFSSGFALTNKSFDIYLISLALLLLFELPSLPLDFSLSVVLSLLSTIGLAVNFGFSISIPVFLLQKQQDKPLDLRRVVSVTIQNTKRAILPLFYLFILGIIFLVFLVIFLHPTREQAWQFFQDWANSGNKDPRLLILPIILSFFVFTSFLFSLEQRGFFRSMKDSVLLSFRNLPYLVLIIIIEAVSWSVISFLPSSEFWSQFLRYVISLYISLVIAASTLFYYQRVVKGEKNNV